MANNPKRMFDEERHEQALKWKERRDRAIFHPCFLSCVKETVTFGDWTDYEMLWFNLQVIFNSSYHSKHERDLLEKIESKFAQLDSAFCNTFTKPSQSHG